jgi:guanyl-specific ribonuclease Sa
VSTAHALAWQIPGAARERRSAALAGAGGPSAPPLVAILCAAPRAHAAAAGVALALARLTGRPCALAGAVAADARTALPAMPTARRTAAALQRRELPASASGRLVWLADRRGPLQADDVPSRCAALSAELGRSAAALGAPAAVAFPFVRTDALDRVLAWHDAIVLVREPDAPDAVIEHALASLARLGRPAAAMTPPSRLSGALALAGVALPSEAADAVGELTRGGFGRRDDGGR